MKGYLGATMLVIVASVYGTSVVNAFNHYLFGYIIEQLNKF